MENVQIMLADDDEDDRSLFREAVEEVGNGAALLTVEDGEELMDYIKEIDSPPPPDIIFLDQYARQNG